jgi:putative pyruvate formate lyase activating enzyme
MTAGYLQLYKSGQLDKRSRSARSMLSSCSLCPRQCRVDRLNNEIGFCKTGRQAGVASYGPHFGEEQPLVGKYGSGTIFFTGCNLGCVFCQNYDISQSDEAGTSVSPSQLAAIMLELQNQGCHNINFVTPSHVVPQLLEALVIAVEQGLKLPLIYNSSGYEKIETLLLLDGVIDIYMPDFKFWSPSTSAEYAQAPDYPEVARNALIEMHRQVGELQIENKVAVKGVLVRHLLMPGLLGETEEILGFIASKISRNTYINIMDQYRPCGEADTIAQLNKPLDADAYSKAVNIAQKLELTRLDQRDFSEVLKKLFADDH